MKIIRQNSSKYYNKYIKNFIHSYELLIHRFCRFWKMYGKKENTNISRFEHDLFSNKRNHRYLNT